jgi:hypothetical protein
VGFAGGIMPHLNHPSMMVSLTWWWSTVQELIEADVPVYPSVAELYLQARLGIHLHVFGRVCGACGERHDLCVVLHRAKLDEGEVDVGVVGRDPNLGHVDGGDDRDEQAVFVEVREPVEDGERVHGRARSVVRLYSLDECPLVASDALDPWCPNHLESAFIGKDRELGVAGPADTGRREFVDEVVKRGADVVNHVADHRSKVARRLLADDCVQDVLDRFVGSRCSVGPESERRRVAFAEGRGLLADSLDVRLGPVELQKDSA